MKTRLLLFMLSVLLLGSCAFYKQNRMFRTEKGYSIDSLKAGTAAAEQNYTIQPNDYIRVFVYTNKGERIIDPNFELRESPLDRRDETLDPRYLVRPDGTANLPMVGEVYLQGMTVFRADSLLAEEYSRFYQDVFVITTLANKRVTVLGPLGGKVVPLENQNMNLIEVIALYGGIGDNGKAHNIRLIRGHLDNPVVQIIDLSTIEGMRQASLAIQSGDIVYIEQSRKVFTESVRDIAPLIGLIGNIVTILFLISR